MTAGVPLGTRVSTLMVMASPVCTEEVFHETLSAFLLWPPQDLSQGDVGSLALGISAWACVQLHLGQRARANFHVRHAQLAASKVLSVTKIERCTAARSNPHTFTAFRLRTRDGSRGRFSVQPAVRVSGLERRRVKGVREVNGSKYVPVRSSAHAHNQRFDWGCRD